jgi:hypothetical protein
VSAGQPGWNRAYASELEINGAPATVEVVACDLDLASAVATMRPAYEAIGGRVWAWKAEALAWGVAIFDDRIVRFLAIAGRHPLETIVFRLDQTRDGFAASMRPPSEHRLRQVPALTGSRPVSCVTDPEAGFAIETSEGGASPDEAFRFLRGALEDEGWVSALPTGSAAGPGSALIYARGRDVCIVRVHRRASDGETVVTRVLKRPAGGGL